MNQSTNIADAGIWTIVLTRGHRLQFSFSAGEGVEAVWAQILLGGVQNFAFIELRWTMAFL